MNPIGFGVVHAALPHAEIRGAGSCRQGEESWACTKFTASIIQLIHAVIQCLAAALTTTWPCPSTPLKLFCRKESKKVQRLFLARADVFTR